MTSILDMDNNEARKFFMEPTSYFDVILPKYFNLSNILSQAKEVLNGHSLNSIKKSSPSRFKIWELNYALYINENGKYDWEPFYLIHPVVYVDLVNYITSPKVWNKIITRFRYFNLMSMIHSYSIPSEDENNRNTYIKINYKNMKNDIIDNYTKYNYCVTTHIVNCYDSVYTHTIPWALEGKSYAKHHRDDKTIGNKIDKRIRNLQSGQTDGIPKGNLIFDFLIELILSYADFNLYNDIKNNTMINDFKLLRCQNKYFIFTKSKKDADVIMKWLLVELEDLNMHFNGKTTHIFRSNNMILHLINSDKLYKSVLVNISKRLSLKDELLQIKTLSNNFPNSRSITNELFDCYKKLINNINDKKNGHKNLSHIAEYLLKKKNNKENNYTFLIDIIISIIVKNPRSFLMGIFLISSILYPIHAEQIRLKDDTVKDKLKKEINHIRRKFNGMAHTEYADIWIQRFELCIDDLSNKPHANNYELYGKVLNSRKGNLWASDWMHNGFSESHIINKSLIHNIKLQIDPTIIKTVNKLYG